jgi:hypothetical protein
MLNNSMFSKGKYLIYFKLSVTVTVRRTLSVTVTVRRTSILHNLKVLSIVMDPAEIRFIDRHLLKGHGNEADFPRFLHKSVWHRSLTLHDKPF